jgi:penicillin-binding protein 2
MAAGQHRRSAITPVAPKRSTPVRLPRRLSARPLVEPISSVRSEFFGSAGFYVRVGALGVIACGVFAVLGLRLWSLQVIQGRHYAQMARRQTYRYADLPLPRGAIVDAGGRPLVESTGRLELTVEPSVLGHTVGRRWVVDRGRRGVLRRVSRLTGLPVPALAARVERALVRSPYTPAVVVPRLSYDHAAYVEERRALFWGIDVRAAPDRRYPQGAFGSEFLGLLGEIDAQQLKERYYGGYRAGEVIGQSGVEKAYDRRLNGGLERTRVPVDAVGRPIARSTVLRRPRPPRTLQLTIDARLQRVAEQAVRDGIRLAHENGHADSSGGAAVVMNPWTGAIYALASYPHFDQLAAAKDPRYLARLLSPRNTVRPLVDRATQGLYPVGSAFKPIVAEAALSAGIITPYSSLPCTSTYTVGNAVFHNVEAGIDAMLTLPEALSISCDTWFYRVGDELYWLWRRTGASLMQNWAKRLGLGHPTGIDVPGEAAGVVPTPGWLRRTFTEPWQRIWYEGYSVNLSIGQGYLAVTPLQVAVAYSALANGGTVVRPHVGKALLRADGSAAKQLRFPPRARVSLPDLPVIHRALYDAAHSGTSASVFSSFPVAVDGKTGTAQTGSGSDHSWYASWAPADSPRVVVVVLIEHGGFGAEAAAPAAKEIYSAFFHLK